MPDWADGYVSDIEYVPGFYLEQTPTHLDVVCLLSATEPARPFGKSFRYCELGCGIAETALTIAAANPHAEIWAFDFNPAHIARATAMAEAAGLANAHVEEASFEELAASDRADLGMFDYVVMHGVWTWVSMECRRQIVEFLRRHLRPGGLVYVTYNALPGWTTAMPLQRLIAMFANAVPEPSAKRMEAALDMVTAFAKAGSSFAAVDFLNKVEKERDRGNFSYLSHEYLNVHWSPCYHVDLARDFADAKLNYVGSANLFENFPDLSLTAEQREIVAKTPSALRETAKDYFMSRFFRRDAFVRGVRHIPEPVLDARIRDIKLALVVPEDAIKRDIKVPLGEASLNEGFYQPALAALNEAPRTVGELIDLSAGSSSKATPREVLGMLTGSHQAKVLANEVTDESRASAMRYNRVLLAACADRSRSSCALAASGTGSGTQIGAMEMIIYDALISGVPAEVEPLAEAAWTLLDGRGERVTKDGKTVEDVEENKRLLSENMRSIVDAIVPIWRRIGAL